MSAMLRIKPLEEDYPNLTDHGEIFDKNAEEVSIEYFGILLGNFHEIKDPEFKGQIPEYSPSGLSLTKFLNS